MQQWLRFLGNISKNETNITSERKESISSRAVRIDLTGESVNPLEKSILFTVGNSTFVDNRSNFLEVSVGFPFFLFI